MTEEAEQGIGFIAEAADPLKVAKAIKGGKAESARRNMPSRRSFLERTPSEAENVAKTEGLGFPAGGWAECLIFHI
jgi:hypothetical protein